MQQLRTAATASLLTLLFVLLLILPCFANGLIPPPDWTTNPSLLGSVLLIAFVLTVTIESLVVCVVLWLRWLLWWRVCGTVGLVNLITFPLTQVAWWVIKYLLGPASAGISGGTRLVPDIDYVVMAVLLGPSAVVPVAMLELLVAVAEFLLLRWLLGRLWLRGFLDKPVSNARLVAATVAANAASFVFGYCALQGTNVWGFIDAPLSNYAPVIALLHALH